MGDLKSLLKDHLSNTDNNSANDFFKIVMPYKHIVDWVEWLFLWGGVLQKCIGGEQKVQRRSFLSLTLMRIHQLSLTVKNSI